MNFSIKKLVSSLIDIIISSPSSMLFIILGLIFTVAMIINIKKNKTIGKTLYLIGWIFIISFIIVKYNNYISKIFDNLINNIFRQIFFPNLATYAIIIIITNIIFLYTIFHKKSNTINKIINTFFFIIIMVLMVFTIDLVSKNNINIYQQKEVYSNENIITIIESTTLIFTLWLTILLSKYILNILIKKSNEKIKEQYVQQIENKKIPTTDNLIPINNIDESITTTDNLTPINNINENIPATDNITPINNVNENVPTTDNITPINNINENIPATDNPIPINNINENITTTENPIPINNVNESITTTDNLIPIDNINENIPTTENPIPIDNINENITTTDNPIPIDNINENIPTTENPIPINNIDEIKTTNTEPNMKLPENDDIEVLKI